MKRCKQKISGNKDGEGTHSTVEDQNKQNYALENGGFHCDENGNSEDKDKGTKLWAKHLSASLTVQRWYSGDMNCKQAIQAQSESEELKSTPVNTTGCTFLHCIYTCADTYIYLDRLIIKTSLKVYIYTLYTHNCNRPLRNVVLFRIFMYDTDFSFFFFFFLPCSSNGTFPLIW